jgi:hypothetical protein
MDFIELTNEQRRQTIDSHQVHDAFWSASDELRRRFDGSMRWVTRKGRDYLHRKRGTQERSLGPRSAETERRYEAFIHGRERCRADVERLSKRLDLMAPVNRALNLGRVPKLTARILRMLDQQRLLGTHLLVVGTNALFAYEARAGVHVPSELLATQDADLLWDVRSRVELLVPEVRRRGVLALLQKVDHSFRKRGGRDFRAFNRDGFIVDLIRPLDKRVMNAGDRHTIGDSDDDLHGVPIEGLEWLLNVPRFEAVAMAEDGYALRIVTVDPRAFALHKLWVAGRQDRDPLKRPRDRAQACAAADLARRWLGLGLDDEALSGLPKEVRALADVLAQ